MEKERGVVRQTLAANLCAPGENGPLFHAQHFCFDIAIQLGFVFELTALGCDRAFDFTEELHLTCLYISLDVSIFTNGDLALVRVDLTVDFAVNDHVIAEFDGAGDFDSICENVGCISHNELDNAPGLQDGNQTMQKNGERSQSSRGAV